MPCENNPCVKIFQELIEKNCIRKSKNLKESNDCRYFQAVPPDIIQYHPDMKNLHIDSIRFCLLHEENHNRHPYRTCIIFIFIAAVLALFFKLVFSLSPLNLIVLMMLIIALGIFLKRREEYQCDKFAAITITNEFSIEGKPSDILKMTLKLMPYTMMSAIIHPSHKKRIKNIAKMKTNS